MTSTQHRDVSEATVVDATPPARGSMVAQRAAWSPVQAIALISGIAFIVVGAVALSKTGLDVRNAPATRAHVDAMGFTSLSAVVVVVVGVLMAAAAADAWSARSLAWVVGIAELAAGLVVAMSPHDFARWLGFNVTDGVVLAIAGGILMIAAAVSPIYVERRWRTVHREVVHTSRGEPR